jgi:hypothetical protein
MFMLGNFIDSFVWYKSRIYLCEHCHNRHMKWLALLKVLSGQHGVVT